MAKKWSKKEINEYLSTKQISQENYVAPTVQTNYQPSIESTVNAFNSVQPTVSQPTISNTQTTVEQPQITQPKLTEDEINNKKKELYNQLITSKSGEERQKGIQEYNKRVAELYGDTKQDTQNKIQEYNDKVAKLKGNKTKQEIAEENDILSNLKDGYQFGDIGKTIYKTAEKKVIEPMDNVIQSFIQDPSSTIKTFGPAVQSGFEKTDRTIDRALQDFFNGITGRKKTKVLAFKI